MNLTVLVLSFQLTMLQQKGNNAVICTHRQFGQTHFFSIFTVNNLN